jgi:hypothetical protein
MLNYNTLPDELLQIIKAVCTDNKFRNFRLCGGTGLALQAGHRISVDADFVTAQNIITHDLIQNLTATFKLVSDINTGTHGVFCKIGNIKVDFLSWNIPFIRNEIVEDDLVIAHVEEIIAMKIFAILQRGQKKDYMDIGSMLKKYSLKQMIGFYKERNKGSDDLTVIRFLSSYSDIENQPEPIMLNGLSWQQCKSDLKREIELMVK